MGNRFNRKEKMVDMCQAIAEMREEERLEDLCQRQGA